MIDPRNFQYYESKKINKKAKFINIIVIISLVLISFFYVTLNSVYPNPIACTKPTAVCLRDTFLFDAEGIYKDIPRSKIIRERIEKIADDKTIKLNDLQEIGKENQIIIENTKAKNSDEKVIITENIELNSDSDVKKYLYLQILRTAIKDYRDQNNNLNIVTFLKTNSIVNFILILIIGIIFIRFSKFPSVVKKMAELSNTMVISGLKLENLFKDNSFSIDLYRSIAPFIFLVILGYSYIIIYSISFLNLNSFLDSSLDSFSIFGNISIVATSILLVGGLTGFFFGVPRIEQQNKEESQSDVLFNTNLVQISDWLTKILVGVGLTQIRPILSFFYNSFIIKIAPGFTSSQITDSSGSISMAIGVVIYYFTCGFFMGYIWGNMYYTPTIKAIVLVGNLSQKVEEFDKEKDKILTMQRIVDLIPFSTIDDLLTNTEFVYDNNESKKTYQELNNKSNILLSEINKRDPDFPENLDKLFEEIAKDIDSNGNRFNFFTPEYYFNFAILLMLNKDKRADELALKFLNKAIKNNPYEYNYYRRRAFIQKRMNDFQGAEKDYNKAIKINPYRAETYNDLGVAKLIRYLSQEEDLAVNKKLKTLYEILQLFDKAIILEPHKKPSFYSNRGYTYFKLAMYDDALKDYDKAITINNDFAIAWYNKACLYAFPNLEENVPNDFRKAIYCLENAINKYPVCKVQAPKDKDFNLIKDSPQFQALVN